MESWKSQIQSTKEAIERLEQQLGSLEQTVIEIFPQQIANLWQKIYGFDVSNTIDKEGARSISRKQQSGVKRVITDIS